MTKKSILTFLLAGSFCLLCADAAVAAGHPAAVIASYYAREGDDLSGINPYIITIYALSEVRHARHLDEVRDFILWYFSRINERDQFGLSGTMYDYVIENGVERPTGSYDSADGYAGLFLHLVHQYVLKTDDVRIVRSHWKQIESIARVLLALQDERGLTKAVPGRSAKYLMDNCEAFGGMTGYAALRKRIGKRDSAYFGKARESLKKAVLAQFYDPARALFFWAIDDAGACASDWTRFYPDAFAQLFPIYFGILSDNALMKQSLWISFTKRHEAAIGNHPVEQRLMYELTKSTLEATRP